MKTKILLSTLIILFVIGCSKDKDDEPTPTPTPNYTNFKILSLKVTAMSFTDGAGAGWDPVDGPDVFFNMEDQAGNILADGSGSKIQDALPSDLPFSWTFTNAYQITNLTVTHYVTLYDYDTFDPNDFINKVGFTLNDHKSGYPTKITKSNGTLTVEITGAWY